MSDDRFCPLCDVSMDLHPWPDDPEDPGCEIAESKARLLERFGGLLR